MVHLVLRIQDCTSFSIFSSIFLYVQAKFPPPAVNHEEVVVFVVPGRCLHVRSLFNSHKITIFQSSLNNTALFIKLGTDPSC
mmetsp:Transcript_23242/g.35243  ORF Transcript_23242/g.35243 Transcript_23242/m.35243 type:complete len:82 (-) Transcript_23242:83-328(-)